MEYKTKWTKLPFFCLLLMTSGNWACSNLSNKRKEIRPVSSNANTSYEDVENADKEYTSQEIEDNKESTSQEIENSKPSTEEKNVTPAGNQKTSCKPLKKHPSRHDVACFSSVAEFIEALPLDTRKRYALVHTSKSRQKEYSTLKHPRLIIYSQYGESLFGISTHPDDPDREEIEFAQLNESSGLWEFFAIDFSKKTEKFTDGNSCINCHGPTKNNLAPIWKEYHLWPHAYNGGERGKMDECSGGNRALTEEQAANLNRIIAEKESSDRFKHIEFSQNGGYKKCNRLIVPGGTINLAFTRALNTAQVRAAMIKMKKSPHYLKHRFTLILDGKFCTSFRAEIPADVLASLKGHVDKHYVERYPNQNLNTWLKTTEVLGVDTRTNFRFQEPFFENGQFNEAGTSYLYNAGRNDIGVFIQNLVMHELVKEFPSQLTDPLKLLTDLKILENFYIKHTGSRDIERPSNHVKGFGGSAELCKAIAELARPYL